MAGLAFNARLIIAKVVGAGRDGFVARRGRRNPLGGRAGRASDQPLARRCARSAQLGARYLLAGRAGCGRVRLLEGGGRRGGGRERAAVARDAVGVRALSGGAPARDRRQRGAARRIGAGVLEPRRRLQRPRRARRRHLLDDPAATRRPVEPAAPTTLTPTAARSSSRTRSAPRSPRRRYLLLQRS